MRFSLRKALAGVAALATLAAVSPFIGGMTSAYAATNNGVATMSPTSGTSATNFTLGLGATPACPGDSASGGYRVQSFMIPASADIDTTLTFGANGPTAVNGQFRQPLFDATSSPYVNKLTDLAVAPAVTGGISGLPEFNWGSVFAPGDVPAGQYNIGIACTLGSAGPSQLVSYWVEPVTITTTGVGSGGPAQFTWAETTPVEYKVDAEIRRSTQTTYVGDGIYNSTGAGQSSTTSVRRGQNVSFVVRIRNEAPTTDTITVQGPGNTTGFSVKYFQGTTDVTAQVVAGTFQFLDMAPNSTSSLKVKVTVAANATVNAIKTVKIKATSVGDPTKKDAVKAKVTAIR